MVNRDQTVSEDTFGWLTMNHPPPPKTAAGTVLVVQLGQSGDVVMAVWGC